MIIPTQKYMMTNAIKYTHRTRSGHLARILCTDFKGSESSVLVAWQCDDRSEALVFLLPDLKEAADAVSPLDLFERSKWDDVAVDTPIWVRDREDFLWDTRHFARYGNGTVYAWCNGGTSHTVGAEPPVAWVYATLENPNKQPFKPGV